MLKLSCHTKLSERETIFLMSKSITKGGWSRDADIIVGMIKDGASNEAIVDAVASAYRDLEKVERVRSMYRDVQFKNCWRNLEVTYIFSKTGKQD